MSLIKIPGIIAKIPPGKISQVAEEVRKINLGAVSKVVATYDPFKDGCKSIRQFIFHISSYKLRRANPKLKVETVINCDRCEPVLTFDLVTGKKVVFKTENLNDLEMLQLYNKHITPHGPSAEDAKVTLSSKALKKSKK